MFSCISEWTEHHAGLAGWVGAVGSILAVFVAWGLARAEYLRGKRELVARKRSEIDLLIRVISQYENLMNTFKNMDPESVEATSFRAKHLNDPEFHGIRDLAFVPVMSWPSLEIYALFKKYQMASDQLLQSAGITNVDAKQIQRDCKQRQTNTYLELSTALKSARR